MSSGYKYPFYVPPPQTLNINASVSPPQTADQMANQRTNILSWSSQWAWKWEHTPSTVTTNVTEMSYFRLINRLLVFTVKLRLACSFQFLPFLSCVCLSGHHDVTQCQLQVLLYITLLLIWDGNYLIHLPCIS